MEIYFSEAISDLLVILDERALHYQYYSRQQAKDPDLKNFAERARRESLTAADALQRLVVQVKKNRGVIYKQWINTAVQPVTSAEQLLQLEQSLMLAYDEVLMARGIPPDAVILLLKQRRACLEDSGRLMQLLQSMVALPI